MRTIELEKILSVMDDMDRLVKEVNSRYERGDNLDPVDSGFLIIRENLEKVLNSEGIFRIGTFVGDRFDHNIHDAIGTHELDDFERYEAEFRDDQVYQIVRSGWKTDEGVLVRPVQVIVSC